VNVKTLAQIQLAPNDRAAIERAAAILRQKFPIDRVILFGSKARGEDKADSDIDLLVLVPEQLDWRQVGTLAQTVCYLQLEFDVTLKASVFVTEEWECGASQALPLHSEIDCDGVLV
jgi:predicted nucleotidyltransferase